MRKKRRFCVEVWIDNGSLHFEHAGETGSVDLIVGDGEPYSRRLVESMNELLDRPDIAAEAVEAMAQRLAGLLIVRRSLLQDPRKIWG